MLRVKMFQDCLVAGRAVQILQILGEIVIIATAFFAEAVVYSWSWSRHGIMVESPILTVGGLSSR